MPNIHTSPIPTNIITGFLGVGKTTAILHLLANKPSNEHWAVLVNEFGEIGIDGALLKNKGAEIREIPGGCMCCVAGLPMQIGLNRLIAKTKPDRLLIEPTGLGHPAQILQLLTSPPYDTLLDVQASITLLDARKLQDIRYTENENFIAQCQLADILVANKMDLSSATDVAAFNEFAQSFNPPKTRIEQVVQGALPPVWLNTPRSSRPVPSSINHQQAASNALQNTFAQLPSLAPGEAFMRKENTGQGFYSCGWMFAPDVIFAMHGLFLWLSGLGYRRVKGVMITEQTILGFNAENGVLSMTELDDCEDSRIEIIHDEAVDWDALEQQILACRQFS